MTQTRCGFVAVVGAPNAGKSTLVNHMVGAHIAIVTPKVQTTRNRILGITTHHDSQLIFIDTPGVFNASARFEKAMVNAALGSTKEADIILILLDAYKGLCKNTQQVLDNIKPLNATKLLVLNKVDKTDKASLLTLTETLYKEDDFAHCFMISALTGDGTDALRDWLAEHMPEDSWHYPEDHITDVPMRQLVAEITRESLFFRLRQELPYSTTVETESWEEGEKAITIRQIIYVQNEGQKKIAIGHKGAMLKEIGKAARQRMERLTESRVHLLLFVKVSERWKEQKEFYTSIGLDY